jgi:hypothetical protein
MKLIIKTKAHKQQEGNQAVTTALNNVKNR